MSETPRLFTHVGATDAGRAELAVDLATRADRPISPMLYGKFCEHLGSNIYHGMEAQILRNPTFGPWLFGGAPQPPDGGYGPLYDPQKLRATIAHHAARWGVDDAEPLVEAWQDGCAFFWARVGPAERVRLSPDVGPNACRAQRVEILAGEGDAGIAQRAFLPLHRTGRFQYRLVARACDPVELTLSLGRAAAGGEPAETLTTATVRIGRDWDAATGELAIPSGVDAPPEAAYEVRVTAPAGANVVLARVLLYPDDHVGGADPDVIRRLREARLPLLRWPGGNFVSGYRWRGGVGPTDDRPTVANPAWACLEPNLFGTDEFLAFCREVGCEPLICVNAGDGTPAEAAAWVEYCNGSAKTPMGRLRAANGHPEPYGVRLWEIGNEIYGRWQVGWTTPGGNLDRYRRFAEAMRAADPTIELLGCGSDPDGEWDRRLIDGVGADLACITHHLLAGGQVDETVEPDDLFHAFMALPAQVAEKYRRNLDRMRDAGVADPRIAVTELQLFAHYRGRSEDSGSPSRGPIPTPSTVAEALYDAVFIHECIRLGGGVTLLTHSATVNHGGGLRKTRERVWPNPAHHGHAMGIELAGATPVAVRLACPTVTGGDRGGSLPAAADMPVLDAMAAVAPDEDGLVLMLVHRSAAHGPVALTIDLGDFAAAGEAEVVTLAGESATDENTFAEPDRVAPRTSTVAVADGKLRLDVPPLSLTRVRLARQGR